MLLNDGEIALALILLFLTVWALKRQRWILACMLTGSTIAVAAAAFVLFIQNASRAG